MQATGNDNPRSRGLPQSRCFPSAEPVHCMRLCSSQDRPPGVSIGTTLTDPRAERYRVGTHRGQDYGESSLGSSARLSTPSPIGLAPHQPRASAPAEAGSGTCRTGYRAVPSAAPEWRAEPPLSQAERRPAATLCGGRCRDGRSRRIAAQHYRP
jgi:hypothetical protein